MATRTDAPVSLAAGHHLTREEFHRRYSARPDIKKAEGLSGVMEVASSVRFDPHAGQHAVDAASGRPSTQPGGTKHATGLHWLACYTDGVVTRWREDRPMTVNQRIDDWSTVIPAELMHALESGELTQPQLRQLITIEAQAMGLSFDDAVRQARARTLPRTALGSDIEMLVELLAA